MMLVKLDAVLKPAKAGHYAEEAHLVQDASLDCCVGKA